MGSIEKVGLPDIGEAWIGVEGLAPCRDDKPIKAMGMVEAKDWPADPWPKVEPVRIDYDAMAVVPADHFEEPVAAPVIVEVKR